MTSIFRIESILLTLLYLSASPAFGEMNLRRDGNWWGQQSQTVKAGYMVGFLDGMELGRHFTYWNLNQSDGDDNKCTFKSTDSYNKLVKKFFAGVNAKQIDDGLDDFYKDFKNRRIEIHDAVWLVLNEIAGTPKEQMDTMIESWRRSATTSAQQ